MASARAGEEQISRRSSTYCGFALLVDSVEDAYVLRVWPEADLAGKTQRRLATTYYSAPQRTHHYSISHYAR